MANFTVTNLNDAGAGSLRQAILDANAAADADTIDFDAALAGGTIVLTSGELVLSQDVTINGDTNGDLAADITISGDADGSGTGNAGDSRIFNVFDGYLGAVDATLQSLTLTGGYVSYFNRGGAISTQNASSLTIENSTVRDSASSIGGGIASLFTTTTISNSTFNGNSAEFRGGGIYINGGDTVLTNVTAYDNQAGSYGAGVYNVDTAYVATLTVNNSTITGNRANYDGNGSGSAGGLFMNKGTLFLNNTVIADNVTGASGADVEDDLGNFLGNATISAENSFFGAISTVTNDLGGNIGLATANDDPMLGALADNGGPVQTREVLAGSALIDAGSNALVPGGVTTDANGSARIGGASVDIGAFEFIAPPQIINLDGDQVTFLKGQGAVNIDAAGTPTNNNGTAPHELGLSDVDSADFDTGNLTVSVTAGNVAGEDVLGFDAAVVTLSGGDALPDDGETVSVGGTIIGTIAAGGNGRGGNDLVVTLNASATPALVRDLMREVQYDNTNTINPDVSARTVTITVADGDGGVSDAQDITVNITKPASGMLTDSGQNLGSSGTHSVVFADVDGDGDLDVLEANFSAANKVWLNDGTGTFTDSGQSLGAGASVVIVSGDIDGDGDLDMVVGNYSGQANTVWTNDGTGIFTDSGQTLGALNTHGASLGDVDGDGDLDIFFTEDVGAGNTVWLNDGSGTFTDSGQTLGAGDSYGVEMADLDGDGDLDAFVVNKNSDGTIWVNDGLGNFSQLGTFPGIANPKDVALGDVDGDGDIDAVVVNAGGGSVFLNDGLGAFTYSGQSLVSGDSWNVALADMDGDGDLDAVIGVIGVGKLFLNDGSGTFTDSGQGLGNHNTRGVAVGDVDNDGNLDVVAGNLNQGNRVFINTNSGPTFDATLTNLTAAFTFDGDGAIDRFGRSVSAAGDVNGDGFDDVIVGAPYDSNSGTYSGSARVLSGADGSILFTFDGDSPYDSFGFSVSSAGDVNGDGFDDVIVGIRQDDNNGNGSGSAQVLSGKNGSTLFTFDGDSSQDYLGTSVSSAGDVNGDGFDDVIVGAPFDDNNGNGSGSARIISGQNGAVLFTFDGDSIGDRFGRSVSSAGDVNGDGFDDVVVGAHYDANNGSQSGSARVFSGIDGAILFTFDGDSVGDKFGWSVSSAGDVNGDGFDDVIVGARDDDNNGLGTSGSARVHSGQNGSVLLAFDGDGGYDQFGYSVSSAGDVNGDGFDDVIVGAQFDDNNGLSNSGSARVLSGQNGSVLFTFDGDSLGDRFGNSVSSAGDVNGDGFDDVIVGARDDDNNGNLSGSARLFTTTGTGRLDSVRAFAEGNAAVTLDSDVAVADAELDALNGGNGDYDGASLNIQRQGGGNGDDVFDFAAMASVVVNGGNLEVLGVAIATFTAVGGVLNISFTNGGTAPTTALVNEILQAVTYENQVQDPGLGVTEKTIFDWHFSDGIDVLSDTIAIVKTGIDSNDVFVGTAGVDTINAGIGTDTVNGLDSADVLNGQGGADTLSGDAGDDTINGGRGGDTINGGADNDSLYGSFGDDIIDGGDGDDLINGNDNRDTLDGGKGADELRGGAHNDTLNGGTGNDMLFGDGDNDILNGNRGNDKLYGGDGNDTLNGLRNVDILKGQAGNDNLDGGDGNDFLFGGAGRDLLTGGAGTDTFVFNAGSQEDIILDFEDGTDLIDIRTRGFADFNADVLANAVQNGAQVDITFGGDTLTIRSFLLADFDAGDVLF